MSLHDLREAAKAGDVAKVESLLKENGKLLNERDRRGWAALHYAVRHNRKKTAEVLLKRGAEVEVATADNHGRAPLHLGAAWGSSGLVEMLLIHGANVDTLSKDGSTPLHQAAGYGRREIVKTLLAHKASVCTANKYGDTPLHQAAPKGKRGVVEVLLANGANVDMPNKDGATPLHLSAHKGKREVLELLLAHGANAGAPSKDGNTPLHEAAFNGETQAVKVLLAHRANVNAFNNHGSTPLHRAAYKGRREVVEVLLAHGADVDTSNNYGATPLYGAAQFERRFDRKDLIEVLLAYGSPVMLQKPSGCSFPTWCVIKKDPAFIDKENLEKGRSVTTGNPKLIKCCREGDLGSLRKLFTGEPNLLNRSPEALLEACKWGHVAIAEFLIDEKQVPIVCHPNLRAPLHEAARRGHHKIIRTLLARGAASDVTDREGNTPLHEAARWGKWPSCSLLATHGASSMARNRKGKTPVDVARECGWAKVVEVLENKTVLLRDSALTELSEDSKSGICEDMDMSPIHYIRDKVLNGEEELSLALIRDALGRGELKSVQDLAHGHHLLMLARRSGLLDNCSDVDFNGKPFFLEKLYRSVFHHIRSKAEIDAARIFLLEARGDGLLRPEAVEAILRDAKVKKDASGRFANAQAVLWDIYSDIARRLDNLETFRDDVSVALSKFQRSLRHKERARRIASVAKLGLVLIPLAGHYAGEAVGAAAELAVETVFGGLVKVAGVMVGKGAEWATEELVGKLKAGNPASLDVVRLVLSRECVAACPENRRRMLEELLEECFHGSLEDLRVAVNDVLDVDDSGNGVAVESHGEGRGMRTFNGREGTTEIKGRGKTGYAVRHEIDCTQQSGNEARSGEGNDVVKTGSVDRVSIIEDMNVEQVTEILIEWVCKGLTGDTLRLVESALRSGARSYPLYGRSLLEPLVSPEELASILLGELLLKGSYKGVYHVTVGFVQRAREGQITAAEVSNGKV